MLLSQWVRAIKKKHPKAGLFTKLRRKQLNSIEQTRNGVNWILIMQILFYTLLPCEFCPFLLVPNAQGVSVQRCSRALHSVRFLGGLLLAPFFFAATDLFSHCGSKCILWRVFALSQPRKIQSPAGDEFPQTRDGHTSTKPEAPNMAINLFFANPCFSGKRCGLMWSCARRFWRVLPFALFMLIFLLQKKRMKAFQLFPRSTHFNQSSHVL